MSEVRRAPGTEMGCQRPGERQEPENDTCSSKGTWSGGQKMPGAWRAPGTSGMLEVRRAPGIMGPKI